MLLGNIALLLRSPGRFFGGATLSCERANFNNPGDERNLFVGQGGISPTGGQPNGARHPYTWTMPKGNGGLSSYERHVGTGTITSGNLAGGKNAEATLDGYGEIASATAQLIVSAVAALIGEGVVSDANLLATLNAVAALTGSGTAAADIVAKAWAQSGLTGSGVLELTPYATGTLEAEIATIAAEVTPETVAAAVWEALTSQFNTAGTMGKALQDASAAGNPWAADLVANNDSGTFGERIQKLLTTGKFLGLK